MFSFVGDTVLDPFLGSGTTCQVARELGRNSVGYEVNPRFQDVIERQMGLTQSCAPEDATIEITAQQQVHPDREGRLAALPYVFRDPAALDKKVDPRENPYGSRVHE